MNKLVIHLNLNNRTIRVELTIREYREQFESRSYKCRVERGRAWSSQVERRSLYFTRSPRKRYGLSQFKWGRGPPMRHAVANVLSKTATNA